MRAAKPPPPPARKERENARQRGTHGPIRAPLTGQAKMPDSYAASAPIPSGLRLGGGGRVTPWGQVNLTSVSGWGCYIIPGCGSPGCWPAAALRRCPSLASRRDFGAWHGSQRLMRLSRSWVPPKAWGRMWSTCAAGLPHFWQVLLSRVRAACRRWAGAPPLVGLSHCLPMVLPPWVAAVLWRFMRDDSPFCLWLMCCLLCCFPVPWPVAGGAGAVG